MKTSGSGRMLALYAIAALAVLTVILTAPLPARASEVVSSGGFSQGGFDVYYYAYNGWDNRNEARLDFQVDSTVHQIYSVNVRLGEDWWPPRSDGKTRFNVDLTVYGERQAPISTQNTRTMLYYSRAGIDYFQSAGIYLNEWQEPGGVHRENTCSLDASITNAKWEDVAVRYNEWTDGGGKGFGPTTRFSWDMQAHGYFDNPIVGVEFMAALAPEPASALFLGLGLPLLRRRRRQ